MFIGHFAVGFASKRLVPQVSLGTLFLAAQFIDVLWPTLLLLGLEHVRIAPGMPGPPLAFIDYPISHSLLAVCLWASLFGAVHFALKRSSRSAVIVALLVVSHWLLDLVVHYPDLPLYPGSRTLLGLRGWSYPLLEMGIELALFIAALSIYMRMTQAGDRIGKWALWSLVAMLILIQVSNSFGSPPPNVAAIAWVGQAQWLLIIWGYWIDRHRHRKT